MGPIQTLGKETSVSSKLEISHCAVFGAAQGIGAEISAYLRDHGSSFLLLLDRNERFTESTAPRSQSGEYLLRADVSQKGELERALHHVSPQTLDLVVLSAGIRSDDEADMRRVNADGVRNALEAIAPLMKKAGLVILVSSDYFNVNPTEPYAKSKLEGALHALHIAEKHANNFRVLILLPGPVRTALFERGKPPALLERIEAEDGILSTKQFCDMLFTEVIPQFINRPSGSVVAMYKHAGITWAAGLQRPRAE